MCVGVRRAELNGVTSLTRHSMAIEIGSDCFLQLVVRRRLLKPQAQVVLQVLVELVTWKEHERGEIESTHFNVTQQQNLLLRRRRRLLRPCAVIQAKIKVAKGRDISNANVLLECTSQAPLTPLFTDFSDVKKSPNMHATSLPSCTFQACSASQRAELRLARRR